MKFLWLPLLLGLQVSADAFAFPEWGSKLPVAPEFAAATSVYDFAGTVALSNCSGSLVRFDDSRDSDQALVLSNGHCTGMITPGTAIIKKPGNRSFVLLNSKAQKLGSLRSDLLLYATMTKTDMSLYQLKETYQSIRDDYQVEALTLARQSPAEGDEIEIISGYWKRGYACQVATIVDTLREGKWSFQNSLRFSETGCNTVGGTSGSPVLAAGTRTVVAVNNTGNDGKGQSCATNNPCEVEADGTIVAQKGYSYAQQTYWLYSCRDADGRLDLQMAGCQLPAL